MISWSRACWGILRWTWSWCAGHHGHGTAWASAKLRASALATCTSRPREASISWTWFQMTENWIGYLLRPSWALLVHQNMRNCVLKVLVETLDRFGNVGPLLTWPPPMPSTVQPRWPDQIVFDSTVDSTISIQYQFKIDSIFIQSRLKVIPSWFEVDYLKSIIWSWLFRSRFFWSRLFRSRLFQIQLFRSRLFWSRLFRIRSFRSRLFWSRLFEVDSKSIWSRFAID